MRCLAGFALFIVLYLGGCALLAGVSGGMAVGNGSRNSQWLGRVSKVPVVKKYHALVAVGAGAASLLACSLPTLLARKSRSQHDEWYG
jgi:hypothetical protein